MEAVQGIEDFVNYVVSVLAERPENACVTRREVGSKHVFDVKVDEEDVPRFLGRSGNTVMAVRNLAVAAAEHNGVEVGVEVIEEDNYRRREERRDFRDSGRGGRSDRDRGGRRQRRF
jgi:predicted RNA-binding protein YlqC (UPF0109 family)